MIYLQLFFSFLQIGMFSFGGGYAAMPLIQEQVVSRHGWLDMGEFTNLITISQMTPGPIAINSATFVGTKIAGIPGAVVSTLGCILPSCILVTLLAWLYLKYQKMDLLQSVLQSLRPAVVAMIASAGVSILVSAFWNGADVIALADTRWTMVGIFVICLILAIPVSISLGIASVLPGAVDPSFTASGTYVIRSMLGGIDSFPLLAVPMFVLSGIIMARGGISRKLFDVFAYFMGKRTAGMPCAVVVTCLFYGAISGSAPATVAAVGSMTIPILMEMGYDKKFSTALVAVAGGLGVIIPPSIPFIMYGMASGASVSDLFIAGIIPGVMIGGLLMVYAIYYCKKHGEDQEKKLAMVGKLHDKGLLRVLKDSAFALLSPVIILGCIYTGVASPTEAAVISVFYALIISLFVYKSIKIRDIWTIMVEAIRTYAPILFILAASIAFSRVLTLMQVPQEISAWILAHFTNKIVLLLVLNVFLLIVGMVMDTTPAILILTPILLPIVEAVGIHPIHFGIVMVVNLAIGFVTPPIGVNLFVASSLTDVPVMEIAKKAMPMILYFFAALLIVTFVPAVSLALL